MEEIAIQIVSKTHPIVINSIVIAIGIVIMVWVVTALNTIKENTKVNDNLIKYRELQDEQNQLLSSYSHLSGKYNKIISHFNGIKSNYSEILHAFGQVVSVENVDFLAVFRTITDRMAADLKTYQEGLIRCAIWVPQNNFLHMMVASSGFADYYRNRRSLEINTTVAGHCYRTKKSVIIENVNSDKDFYHNINEPHKYPAMICTPFIYGSECLGVITVDSKAEGSFSEEDLLTIETYAELISMLYLLMSIQEERINNAEAIES